MTAERDPGDEQALPYHVYPVRDDREHDIEGETCWCRPTVELVDPVTGQRLTAPLYIHRDATQRAAEAS